MDVLVVIDIYIHLIYCVLSSVDSNSVVLLMVLSLSRRILCSSFWQEGNDFNSRWLLKDVLEPPFSLGRCQSINTQLVNREDHPIHREGSQNGDP